MIDVLNKNGQTWGEVLSRLFLIIIIFAYRGNGENVKSAATIEGLLTEESEKRKGCGRKAIPPS